MHNMYWYTFRVAGTLSKAHADTTVDPTMRPVGVELLYRGKTVYKESPPRVPPSLHEAAEGSAETLALSPQRGAANNGRGRHAHTAHQLLCLPGSKQSFARRSLRSGRMDVRVCEGTGETILPYSC